MAQTSRQQMNQLRLIYRISRYESSKVKKLLMGFYVCLIVLSCLVCSNISIDIYPIITNRRQSPMQSYELQMRPHRSIIRFDKEDDHVNSDFEDTSSNGGGPGIVDATKNEIRLFKRTTRDEQVLPIIDNILDSLEEYLQPKRESSRIKSMDSYLSDMNPSTFDDESRKWPESDSDRNLVYQDDQAGGQEKRAQRKYAYWKEYQQPRRRYNSDNGLIDVRPHTYPLKVDNPGFEDSIASSVPRDIIVKYHDRNRSSPRRFNRSGMIIREIADNRSHPHFLLKDSPLGVRLQPFKHMQLKGNIVNINNNNNNNNKYVDQDGGETRVTSEAFSRQGGFPNHILNSLSQDQIIGRKGKSNNSKINYSINNNTKIYKKSEGMENMPLGCQSRWFRFRAVKSDKAGNKCSGWILAKACYGTCDTGEFANYVFPFKKTVHKVCKHGKRIKRRVILGECTSDAPDSLRNYYYVDAGDCVCSMCSTQSDTTCTGGISNPVREGIYNERSILTMDGSTGNIKNLDYINDNNNDNDSGINNNEQPDDNNSELGAQQTSGSITLYYSPP